MFNRGVAVPQMLGMMHGISIGRPRGQMHGYSTCMCPPSSSARAPESSGDKSLFKCRSKDIMPTTGKPRPKGSKDNVLRRDWFKSRSSGNRGPGSAREHDRHARRHKGRRRGKDSSDYDDYDDDVLDEEMSDCTSETDENEDWRPAWNSSTKLALGLKQRLEGKTRRSLRLVEESIRADKKAAA